jgi:hypothetical protein
VTNVGDRAGCDEAWKSLVCAVRLLSLPPYTLYLGLLLCGSVVVGPRQSLALTGADSWGLAERDGNLDSYFTFVLPTVLITGYGVVF